jgi:pyridoxal phosphate enzyme (YggS family)
VQELTAHLEADAYAGAREVHFIGHLQTNKVNKVVGRVDLIHSVDSEHLLQAIDRQAEKLGIVQDILLEVNIAGEQSKSGVLPEQAEQLARQAAAMAHVRLRGLMAIPPVAQEPGGNTHYFVKMRQLFVDIKDKIADNKCDMDCLSMGMSGDYESAIAQGATLVRVGTALFGPRPPMAAPRA